MNTKTTFLMVAAVAAAAIMATSMLPTSAFAQTTSIVGVGGAGGASVAFNNIGGDLEDDATATATSTGGAGGAGISVTVTLPEEE
jgi:hypothetical protein